MKIIHSNDFWKTLNSIVAVEPQGQSDFVFAAKTTNDKKEESSKNNGLLGDASNLTASNRFIYEPATVAQTKEMLKDAIKSVDNFESTSAGKKIHSLIDDVNSLANDPEKQKSKNQKLERPISDSIDDEMVAKMLEEVETESQKVVPQKSSDKSPAKVDANKSLTDIKNLLAKMSKEIKAHLIQAIEKIDTSISSPSGHSNESFSEMYVRVFSSKPLFDTYFEISELVNNPELIKSFGGKKGFKNLLDAFRTPEDLSEMVNENKINLWGGTHQILGYDQLIKGIFDNLASMIESKGPFVGKVGRFRIAETSSGGYSINGDDVSIADLSKSYEKFISMLNRAGVNEKTVQYFESLQSRSDMAAVVNKYISVKFMEMLPDIKKRTIEGGYSVMDSAFVGIDSKILSLFKNIIRSMDMFTPDIKTVENETVRVDSHASIKIYEANDEYFVTFNYGTLPPKTFSLDRLGMPGYSNQAIKDLSANKASALQDIYKKILTLLIRDEVYSGSTQTSPYHDAKYFTEIVSGLENDKIASRKKYLSIIRQAQLVSSEGHPAYADDPLAKFSMSINYKNSAYLWVELSRVSDNTFKVTRVDFSDGDRAMGASIINTLLNKVGFYEFDTEQYKNIGDSGADRSSVYRKITAFYNDFLSKEISGVDRTVKTPTPEVVPSKPVEKKTYESQEIMDIYNEFNALSDNEKRSKGEEKRLEQLTDIIVENIGEIKEMIGVEEEMDLEEALRDVERTIKRIPKAQQQKMINRLHEIYDSIDSGELSDAQKSMAMKEIDSIEKILIERGADFSEHKDIDSSMENIEKDLLDISIYDANPSEKTKQAALAQLKYSPNKEQLKQNAKKNFEIYPNIKNYIETIYSPEFVRLTYAD